MKDGRYFSRDFPSDSTAVVLNETAAKAFGFGKAEGQEVQYSPNAFVFVKHYVIGIMKDFNYNSYHSNVQPLAVFSDKTPSPFLMVRYEGNPKIET